MNRRHVPARHQLAILGWLACLAAASWFLLDVGEEALTDVPLSSWEELGRWAERRGEAAVVITVVRASSLVMVGYLMAVSILGGLARFSMSADRALGRLAPAWLRSLLDVSLGLGMVATVGLAATAAPAWPSTPVEVAEPAPIVPGAPTARTLRPLPGDPITIEPIGGDRLIMVPIDSSATDEATTPDEHEAADHPQSPDTWTTAPGDHLWSIADETLADALGRPPSTTEIDRYWRLLVEHNRARLLDARNADLIVPGQIFELPPAQRG